MIEWKSALPVTCGEEADTYETQTLIQTETGQAQAKVACIGRRGKPGAVCLYHF